MNKKNIIPTLMDVHSSEGDVKNLIRVNKILLYNNKFKINQG